MGAIAQEAARKHVPDYLDNVDDELQSTDETAPTTVDPKAELERIDRIEMRDDVILDPLRDEPLFPITPLSEIPGNDEAQVGVYACAFERGLPFIYEYEAWGFIRIASQSDCFCIYLNQPYQQIQLIGKVDDVIAKDEFFAQYDVSRDSSEVADNKKAILFESVYQLSDPIPIGERTHRMQGLLYTSLGNLRSASTTDDF